MQTILGATGQIAVELARELRRTTTGDLRLVSRNPRKVNDGDALAPADLLESGRRTVCMPKRIRCGCDRSWPTSSRTP